MKYHKHEIKKVYDEDVMDGYYYEIYRGEKKIADCLGLADSKNFVDSFDGNDYDRNLLF